MNNTNETVLDIQFEDSTLDIIFDEDTLDLFVIVDIKKLIENFGG